MDNEQNSNISFPSEPKSESVLTFAASYFTLCDVHITPVENFQRKQNTKASSTYKFPTYVFNLISN